MKVRAAAVVAIALIGTFFPSSASGAGQPPTLSEAGVPAPRTTTISPWSASSYWTAGRREAALDLALPTSDAAAATSHPIPRGNAASVTGPAMRGPAPVAPSGGAQAESIGLGLDRHVSATGKLFFTDPSTGVNYSCSASAVNNQGKNALITAAHCLYNTVTQRFYTNMAFAPGYYNGYRPEYLSLWPVNWAVVSGWWWEHRNYSEDYGFATVGDIAGYKLVNVVGGSGLYFNVSPAQPGTRIWGWPVDYPYNGQYPYFCDGNTVLGSPLGPSDGTYTPGYYRSYMLDCGMTGGASGGPWLMGNSQITSDIGYIYAVTSSGDGMSLAAPPLGEAARVMFADYVGG